MLTRKYLGKPILKKESPKVHLDKSSGDIPSLQIQAMDKRGQLFLNKKINKERRCNSRSSIENEKSISNLVMPKYHLRDSLSKNYYETRTIVQNNPNSGIKDCIVERNKLRA